MQLAALLLVLPLVADPAGEEVELTTDTGAVLAYEGEIVAVKGIPEDTRKTFSLTMLLDEPGEEGRAIHWTTTEKGRGAWPWTDVYGRLDVNDQWKAARSTLPSLMYNRDDGYSVVPLYTPLINPGKPLEKGVKWTEEQLEFRVIASEQVGLRDAWQVDVVSPIGRIRRVWIDQQTPVVLKVEQKVFMGTGIEYDLTMQLKSWQVLEAEPLERNVQAFASLEKLRSDLGLSPRTRVVDFTKLQLARLKRELPAITKQAEGTLAKTVLDAAQQDEKFQKSRSGAITTLAKSYRGKTMPRFRLPGLGEGEFLSSDEFKGKVTVLHFWPYRATPLIEPYGQVGYLDHLYRRHKAKGLQIYGVSVDERLQQPRTRGTAIRSTKKLKEFMRLSYPVFLDPGDLIVLMGDPRRLGAELPLFVVIGPDSKVLHYHVGHYKLHPDKGLIKLDLLVSNALEDLE